MILKNDLVIPSLMKDLTGKIADPSVKTTIDRNEMNYLFEKVSK